MTTRTHYRLRNCLHRFRLATLSIPLSREVDTLGQITLAMPTATMAAVSQIRLGSTD